MHHIGLVLDWPLYENRVLTQMCKAKVHAVKPAASAVNSLVRCSADVGGGLPQAHQLPLHLPPQQAIQMHARIVGVQGSGLQDLTEGEIGETQEGMSKSARRV